MRLVTYDAGDGPRPGALLGDRIAPIDAPSVRALLERGGLGALSPGAPRFARSDVRLEAPVLDPEKIICMGLNFRDHAQEAHQEIPEHPRWFAKVRQLARRRRGRHHPAGRAPRHVDYETELAVVIGQRAHRVTESDALSHLAGAMCLNDVSSRDLQLQNPLWTSGKAIDTSAPCGPALVTLDEAGDLGDLAVRTRVNGELLQDGSTRDMIFGVAEIVAWLSRTMTLVPGDVIATARRPASAPSRIGSCATATSSRSRSAAWGP